MRYVPVESLRVGMKIVKTIYNENSVALLRKDILLSSSMIKTIKTMGFLGLYIYDNMDDPDFKIDELISEEIRMQAIKGLKQLNIDQVIYCTNQIVSSIEEAKEICLDLKDLRCHHDYTYQHSVNVSIIAVTIGIGLGMSNKELNELGVAAILHDIGKRCIKKEILDKPGKLTEEEYSEIKKHSEFGYNLVCDDNNINIRSKKGILEHHENEDGTGYPNGLKSKEIYRYAKIIHVADVFDALISERSYKPSYSPGEALEFLMANCGIMFDLEIVNVFINYVAIYPVGARVILSDGRKAQVIKNKPELPLRPTLYIDGGEIADLSLDAYYRNITILEQERTVDLEFLKQFDKEVF